MSSKKDDEPKKTIKKVKPQAKKAVPPEMKETIDLVCKSLKAVKRFDARRIDKIIKDIFLNDNVELFKKNRLLLLKLLNSGYISKKEYHEVLMEIIEVKI